MPPGDYAKPEVLWDNRSAEEEAREFALALEEMRARGFVLVTAYELRMRWESNEGRGWWVFVTHHSAEGVEKGGAKGRTLGGAIAEALRAAKFHAHSAGVRAQPGGSGRSGRSPATHDVELVRGDDEDLSEDELF